MQIGPGLLVHFLASTLGFKQRPGLLQDFLLPPYLDRMDPMLLPDLVRRLAPADTLTAAMTAVTARVLCLPSDGDPHTGSGFILGDGTHLITNWHVVACTREGGQALVPIRQQFSSPSRARRGVLARSPISSRASVPTGRAAASWLGTWAPALGRGHFSGTRSAHRPAANCLARCPWRG